MTSIASIAGIRMTSVLAGGDGIIMAIDTQAWYDLIMIHANTISETEHLQRSLMASFAHIGGRWMINRFAMAIAAHTQHIGVIQ